MRQASKKPTVRFGPDRFSPLGLPLNEANENDGKGVADSDRQTDGHRGQCDSFKTAAGHI